MPETKEEKKPVVKERYEAFHQPEILGIYDHETDTLLPMDESSVLKEDMGKISLEVMKMNDLDKIRKSVVA